MAALQLLESPGGSLIFRFSFQPKRVNPGRYRSIAHQNFDKGRVGVLQVFRTGVSNVLAEQHVDQRFDDKMLRIRNFRKHFLYFFLALYLFADISIASNTTCYYPDGLESKGSPCNPTADVSTCCGPGFVCLSNGLCTPGPNDRKTYDYKFYRSSCTDPTWKSSACPNFCLGRRCSHSIFSNNSIHGPQHLADQNQQRSTVSTPAKDFRAVQAAQANIAAGAAMIAAAIQLIYSRLALRIS